MTREMRSLCFFKHCRLNYNREKTSYFAAKREAFNSWLEIVPGLTQHSKLCARHFDETDLKKGVVIGGDFYPFKAWRLRNGAVPKCHLGKS